MKEALLLQVVTEQRSQLLHVAAQRSFQQKQSPSVINVEKLISVQAPLA